MVNLNVSVKALAWVLRYSDSEDRKFNRVISHFSVVLREITLTILDFNEPGSPVESKTVRVVSLSTTEITEIPRLKQSNDLHGLIP